MLSVGSFIQDPGTNTHICCSTTSGRSNVCTLSEVLTVLTGMGVWLWCSLCSLTGYCFPLESVWIKPVHATSVVMIQAQTSGLDTFTWVCLKINCSKCTIVLMEMLGLFLVIVFLLMVFNSTVALWSYKSESSCFIILGIWIHYDVQGRALWERHWGIFRNNEDGCQQTEMGVEKCTCLPPPVAWSCQSPRSWVSH